MVAILIFSMRLACVNRKVNREYYDTVESSYFVESKLLCILLVFVSLEFKTTTKCMICTTPQTISTELHSNGTERSPQSTKIRPREITPKRYCKISAQKLGLTKLHANETVNYQQSTKNKPHEITLQ